MPNVVALTFYPRLRVKTAENRQSGLSAFCLSSKSTSFSCGEPPLTPASGLALSSLWDLGKSPYVPEAPRGTRRASHQHIVRSE